MVTVWRDVGHESIMIQLLSLFQLDGVFYELGDSGLKEEWEQKRIFKSDFFFLCDFFPLQLT